MGSQASQLIHWKDNPKKALAESAHLTGILRDQTDRKKKTTQKQQNPSTHFMFLQSDLVTSWTVFTLQKSPLSALVNLCHHHNLID